MYKQKYHNNLWTWHSEHGEFDKALVKHNNELHVISLSMKISVMINRRNDTLRQMVGNVYWWFINVFIILPYIESTAYSFPIHCHDLSQSCTYIPL